MVLSGCLFGRCPAHAGPMEYEIAENRLTKKTRSNRQKRCEDLGAEGTVRGEDLTTSKSQSSKDAVRPGDSLQLSRKSR